MYQTSYHHPLTYFFKHRQQIAALLLALFIASCATTRQANTLVSLGNQSFFSLQPVPEKLQGLSTLQQLIVTSTEGKHELLLQTELQKDKIEMVGLSPSGMVIFELTWLGGSNLSLTSNISIDGIDPEVMLAYYQLSNWPVTDVVNGLQGMQLKTSIKSADTREFYKQNQLVFRVQHTPPQSILQHQLDNYQIQILTLESNQIE